MTIKAINRDEPPSTSCMICDHYPTWAPVCARCAERDTVHTSDDMVDDAIDLKKIRETKK